MKSWQLVSIGILIGLLLGGVFLLIIFPGHPATISYVLPTQNDVVVASISGEVKNPGVYSLPIGSRITDLIQLAGGTLDTADPSKIQLAQLIEDGENIEIPSVSIQEKGTDNTSVIKLNLNSATLEELETLPGIGKEKAQAIIDYRSQYGNFSSIQDLMSVPGFGENLFNSIKELIEVE